jgi:hypothetical protein
MSELIESLGYYYICQRDKDKYIVPIPYTKVWILYHATHDNSDLAVGLLRYDRIS